MNLYPFIEAENASTTGNVTRSCAVLQVSRAAYYAHRSAGPSTRERDDAELTDLVRQAIADAGATEPRQMGLVMKTVTPLVAGRADGKRVSNEVRRQLSS